MSNELYNYIIYHNKCIDGFSGFYLFLKSKKWAKESLIYPDQPFSKEIPPEIEGKNVIIIDVAYYPSIIKAIAKKARKLLFIDHHKSIRDGITKLKLKKPHVIIYDVNQSGVSLVWKHFFGNKKMPSFVKYIKDNDIGEWKYKETIPFILALKVKYELKPVNYNLKKWDKLFDEKEIKSLIEVGKIYQEHNNYLIDINSKKYSIMHFPSKKIADINNDTLNDIGEYKVAVVNGGCPTVSLLGKRIVETVDVDFCLIWNYIIRAKKYVVSLRSSEERRSKVDVSKIADYFGGGGHKQASAFSFSSNKFSIDDLFIKLHRR
uniref:Uncharacterized protein n=1 Tax=Mimivirus LCMiAC01 TaxID=2506608 RepID=A0A481Z0B4_9VIRU|nr:MAG: uncharacterized protein LCMiAC01_01840 [Mimivirus LCMiAC01]